MITTRRMATTSASNSHICSISKRDRKRRVSGRGRGAYLIVTCLDHESLVRRAEKMVSFRAERHIKICKNVFKCSILTSIKHAP